MSTSAVIAKSRENLFLRSDLDPILAGEALADAIKFIKSEWGYSNETIGNIIKVSKNTIKNWLDEESVPISEGSFSSEVEALISLIGIHKSLHAMFSTPSNQIEWLSTFHPQLQSKPMDLMVESNENLFGVRRYLDYVRGRGA